MADAPEHPVPALLFTVPGVRHKVLISLITDLRNEINMNQRLQIYAVLTTALVVVSLLAVGLVGAVTASGITQVGNAGGTGNIGIAGEEASLDYQGCSEVWIIFPDENALPSDATIRIYDGQTGSTDDISVTITVNDVERIPGKYGDNPVFKYSVDDKNDKIVAVSVDGSSFVENPNRCADAV